MTGTIGWYRLLRGLALVIALLAPVGKAQILGDGVLGSEVLGSGAPALLNAAARVPFSLELGRENLFARRVGFRVGAALYPLPLLLERDLNVDGFADVTYTLRGGVGGFLARASAALYAGAGPRYRLINSELFLDGGAPGSYLGAGGVAGAEFRLGALGFSLVSAFAEAGTDYLWPVGSSVADGQLTPRVRVGLAIPLVGF